MEGERPREPNAPAGRWLYLAILAPRPRRPLVHAKEKGMTHVPGTQGFRLAFITWQGGSLALPALCAADGGRISERTDT
ncbi:MAG: hypothetical protein FWG50_08230 [Kiritimatiellaeota bacterium]|nr:hypothetical protein [Kiritimatiellota bacterium]